MADVYRSPVLRAKLATGFLFANVVVLLGWAWASYRLRGAWHLDDMAYNELAASFDRMRILYLVAYFPSGIVFLFWFRRVYDNVGALGGRSSATPTMAVGSWFIPFVNWFRPYQITKEIWVESAGDGDSDSDSDSGFIQLWWGLWLINLLGERFLGHGDLETEAQFVRYFTGFIVLNLVSLIAAALAMLVIRRITARQEAHAPATGAPQARVRRR